MRRYLNWFWQKGILSTFLAGLFALLPIVITVGIMVWAGGLLRDWLGPESLIGRALSQLGLRLVTDPTVASVLSWVAVLLSSDGTLESIPRPQSNIRRPRPATGPRPGGSQHPHASD